VCRLVPGLHHLYRVRLERIEKGRRVNRRVYNSASRRICGRLDVWVEEAERGWRLCGEDGEEGEELRSVVVGQVGQCEAFRVVLVYSGGLLVTIPEEAAPNALSIRLVRQVCRSRAIRTGTAAPATQLPFAQA
jgi:hypothetical protein